MTRSLHRQLHDAIDAVNLRHLGFKMNKGAKAVADRLDDMTLQELARYRQELYQVMRQFDASHGTHLTALFRVEFRRQRAIRGREGFFK